MIDILNNLKNVTMTLTHNDHAVNYQTVSDAIESNDHGYTDDCFISKEQKKKSIEKNEHWMVQVYPDTPIGFYIFSACDLDALLLHVDKVLKE